MRKLLRVPGLVLLSALVACRATPASPTPQYPTAAARGLPFCPVEQLAQTTDPSIDWRVSVHDGISVCIPGHWRGGGAYWSWDGGAFVFAEGDHHLLAMQPDAHSDPRRGKVRHEASGRLGEFWYMDNGTRWRIESTRVRDVAESIPRRRNGFSTFGSWPAMQVYMEGFATNARAVAELREVFLTVRFVPIAGTGVR